MQKIMTSRETLDFGIDEHLAYCENQHWVTMESIRNRTMTRERYRELTHFLREFPWRIKQRGLGNL